MRSAAEKTGTGFIGLQAHGTESVEHGHQCVGSVKHCRIDNLSLARALCVKQCADYAEGQQHAATTEVADRG